MARAPGYHNRRALTVSVYDRAAQPARHSARPLAAVRVGVEVAPLFVETETVADLHHQLEHRIAAEPRDHACQLDLDCDQRARRVVTIDHDDDRLHPPDIRRPAPLGAGHRRLLRPRPRPLAADHTPRAPPEP